MTPHYCMLKSLYKRRDELGFTLAEILAVVVIIGVLAAVAIPAGLAQKQRSVDAGMVSDINSIVGVLQSDLSAWRGAPPAEMTITTTDATWQMTSPPAVDGNPPVLEDSGPVTPGNNATGTVWTNGAFCVAATNPGSGNSVVYLSTEEKAVTGPSADNVCPSTAPSGAGTLPEANENDVPPVPTNVDVISADTNQVSIDATVPPTLDPPITSYLVMIPGLEPEDVPVNEIDGWESDQNIQPGATNITVRPINANGAGPGYVDSVVVTGSILQDGTQFLGNVNSTQNLTVNGATSVNGVTNTGNYLGRNVTGWNITGSELNSEGNILALGAISSNGNIYTQSNLSSEGTIYSGSTISSAGTISTNSNLTAAGNVSATGSGAFNNGLTVNNGAAINGNSAFGNNLTIYGGLTGNTGVFTGAVSTGALSSTTGVFTGALTGTTGTFSGTGRFGNTLTVTSGGVAVTGDSTFGNNLNVSGQSTMTGLLTANGGVSSTTGTFSNTVTTNGLTANSAVFNGTWGSKIIIEPDSSAFGIAYRAASSGGWARQFGFQAADGTSLGGFGATGDQSSLDYMYIGSYATATNTRFYNNGNVLVQGATTTSGLTSTTGTFTGNLTGANATFSGTGSFAGLLAANGGLTSTNGTFTGNLSGVNISGTNGTFTGTGSFGGLLTANGGLTSTTGSFSGTMTANGLIAANNGITLNQAGAAAVPTLRFLEDGYSQYGGLVAYDNGADALKIRTIDGGVEQGGVSFARATGNATFFGVLTADTTFRANGDAIFNGHLFANNGATIAGITTINAGGQDQNFRINQTDGSWSYMGFYNNGTRKAYFGLNADQTGVNLGLENGAVNFIVYGDQHLSGNSYVNGSLTALQGISTTNGVFSGDITANSVYTDDWFRSIGATGWYNQTYGGGIYMTDSTWVRTYNEKGLYTGSGNIQTLGTLQAGSVSAGTGTFTGAVSTGALSSTTGTFTGNLTGTNSSFSGTGSYAGLLTANGGLTVYNDSTLRGNVIIGNPASGGLIIQSTADNNASVLLTARNATGAYMWDSQFYFQPSSNTWITESNSQTAGNHSVNGNGFYGGSLTVNNGATIHNTLNVNQGMNVNGNAQFNNVVTATGGFVGNLTGTASYLTSNTTSETGFRSLAASAATGKRLYLDEEFVNGVNGLGVYNNSGNGAVTLTRLTGQSGVPNASGNIVRVEYNGTTASPGFGGFYAGSPALYPRTNSRYIVRFVAKIPVGRTLGLASNSLGTGGGMAWLTPYAGTGKWEEYSYEIIGGTAGPYGNTGHVYATGGANTALTWDIASWTVIDVTDRGDYNVLTYGNQTVGGNKTFTGLTSALGGLQVANSSNQRGARFTAGGATDSFIITPFNASGSPLGNSEIVYNANTDEWGVETSWVINRNLWVGGTGYFGNTLSANNTVNVTSTDANQNLLTLNQGALASGATAKFTGNGWQTLIGNYTGGGDRWMFGSDPNLVDPWYSSSTNGRNMRLSVANQAGTQRPIWSGLVYDDGEGDTPMFQVHAVTNFETGVSGPMSSWDKVYIWDGEAALQVSGSSWLIGGIELGYTDTMINSTNQYPFRVDPRNDTAKSFFFNNANTRWQTQTDFYATGDVYGNSYTLNDTGAYIYGQNSHLFGIEPDGTEENGFYFTDDYEWNIDANLMVGDPAYTNGVNNDVIIIKDRYWSELTLEGDWEQLEKPGSNARPRYKMMPDGTVMVTGAIRNWNIGEEYWHGVATIPDADYHPEADLYYSVPCVAKGMDNVRVDSVCNITVTDYGSILIESVVGADDIYGMYELHINLHYPTDPESIYGYA